MIPTIEILQMLDYLQEKEIKRWCGGLYQDYLDQLAERIPVLTLLY